MGKEVDAVEKSARKLGVFVVLICILGGLHVQL